MRTDSANAVRRVRQEHRNDLRAGSISSAPGVAGVARGLAATDSDPTTRLRAVIGRLSRRLRPTVAGSGLTPSQTSVLFTIARLGPLGLSEISEIEGINPTMLSRIAAQLCQSGLISRESNPGDRRATLVRATPAGQRLRKRIHRERTEALQEHIAKLTDEQRELLWSALPVLETLVEQIPGGRP
jgi:DNA-binding MarR family transcriptional regulator